MRFKPVGSVASCFMLLMSAQSAGAQEGTYFYGEPFIATTAFVGDFGEAVSGETSFDQARLNPAPTLGVAAGVRIGGRLGVEGLFSFTPTAIDVPITSGALANLSIGNDVATLIYTGNLSWSFTTSKTVVAPYVTVGAGAISMSPEEGEAETNLVLNVGAGLEIPIRETVSLRINARDYIHQLEGDFATGTSAEDAGKETLNTLQLSVGLLFRSR